MASASRRVTYVRDSDLYVAESTLDLIYTKDASYGWQQEFRLALIAPLDQAQDNRVSVKLGSLEDLCTIATR